MDSQTWLQNRLTYLRGLKASSEYQKLLLILADKPERSDEEERKLIALIKAERAAERAQMARATAAKIVNQTQAAERKARDHELYQSAGLMILAGLVDSKTGKPTTEKAMLLGGLIALKETLDNANGDKRSICNAWREKGATLLAEKR